MDVIHTPLIKQVTEAALQAEWDVHLLLKKTAGKVTSNRKKGLLTKTTKATSGQFELNTSKVRTGTFEPQLVKHNQPRLTD